jgi:serine/threonine protein kinase
VLVADEFKAGASLGKYEILRRLATGGMAEIYLARVSGTAGFEKLVVLKRILPNVAADHGFVQMFLDEARLAATLRHPNIADVFDVGEEDGSYYFAMEFIHGQDARAIKLATFSQSRELPIEIALTIINGTTYALAYAHAKEGPQGPLGIVHRDVTPSNILVSYDGAVKLVDFGIARADTRSAVVKTRTGTLKGKVPYMSPEQARGGALDRRSDLFSLGGLLYELTTGRRPFEYRSEFETLDAIASGKVKPPSSLIPSYPRDLEAIVMKLLALDPASRYQNADDVMLALERLIKDHGMLVSERVLAKFMRELFAAEIAAWDTMQAVPADSRTQRTPLVDDVPTTEVRLDPVALANDIVQPMQALLVTPDVQVFVRPPTPPFRDPERRSPPLAQPTSLEFPDEMPTSQVGTASRGDTRTDGVLAFDPLIARGDDLLEEIDATAPPIETNVDCAIRRVQALIPRASRWLASGDIDNAVVAAELALEQDTRDERVVLALVRGQAVLSSAFEAFLGDLSRRVRTARPAAELVEVDLDERSRRLVSLVRGQTIRELLDQSGIPRFEACRALTRMTLRKLIVVG